MNFLPYLIIINLSLKSNSHMQLVATTFIGTLPDNINILRLGDGPNMRDQSEIKSQKCTYLVQKKNEKLIILRYY